MKNIKYSLLSCFAAFLFAGCVLCPAPHSPYRLVHKFSSDCDEAGVALVLSTNAAAVNLPGEAAQTPLHYACLSCCSNVVALLLEHHANVNVSDQAGDSPLHYAAQEGCNELIPILIAAGAKIEATDRKGRTPLERAVASGNQSTIDLLHKFGARK